MSSAYQLKGLPLLIPNVVQALFCLSLKTDLGFRQIAWRKNWKLSAQIILLHWQLLKGINKIAGKEPIRSKNTSRYVEQKVIIPLTVTSCPVWTSVAEKRVYGIAFIEGNVFTPACGIMRVPVSEMGINTHLMPVDIFSTPSDFLVQTSIIVL
ncbi:hypothetical protein ILYODFUR_032924 [Ilyodon furcidens]|uniref:Uncharacterized protein n=1 Tax=Ilyodon furcidens TaxID=33524 RepID=A0ABV0TP38_9TELE